MIPIHRHISNELSSRLHIVCLSLLGVFLTSSVSTAQTEDYDYGSYNSYDSYEPDTSSDSSDGYSEDFSNSYDNYFGSSTKSSTPVPKKIVKKPYVRFIPPYDSTLELIIYQAVIEVVDNEGYEVELDTVYGRTQAWLASEFGKDLKRVTKLNDVNETASEMEYKIKLSADFPCIIRPNEFTQVQNGIVKYDMEIRVRDGRYRYAVKNLVHIAEPRVGEKEGVKTYFEYLMKTKDDVRGSDQVLMAADIKITAMINALKKACDTAPLQEDDDW